MFLGLDEVSEDGFLAQRLAGFQPVQTVHEDEAVAVAAHQDGGFLPALQHAAGDFLDDVELERGTAFDRHIDVRDFELFALHHDPARPPGALSSQVESDSALKSLIWRMISSERSATFRDRALASCGLDLLGLDRL